MVVLRDPVERVISGYYHTTRGAELFRYSVSVPVSLEQYVCDINSQNFMVRFLSRCVGPALVANEYLLKAIDELYKYDIVGLTEDMPKTIERVKSLVPTVVEKMSHVNANPDKEKGVVYRSKVPNSIIRLIEHHNALDLALYDSAQKLFYRG